MINIFSLVFCFFADFHKIRGDLDFPSHFGFKSMLDFISAGVKAYTGLRNFRTAVFFENIIFSCDAWPTEVVEPLKQVALGKRLI